LAYVSTAAVAQTSAVVRAELSPERTKEIIAKFAENEEKFRDALKNYVFRRNATMQTIGVGGQISGTFHRVSFMTFNSDGARFERVEYAPVPTTFPGFITPEDLEDLGGVTPFALDPFYIDKYDIKYIGKEKIDELDLYVFDVQPKVVPDPKKTKLRMFQGRIWVDDRDLMIVKSKGKGIPETKKNKFPIVETWRENIDGKFWFPSFASSDDTLIFDSGQVQKIKLRVTYSDYKEAQSSVRVLDEAEEPKEDQQ
jgi:hypothetical protein